MGSQHPHTSPATQPRNWIRVSPVKNWRFFKLVRGGLICSIAPAIKGFTLLVSILQVSVWLTSGHFNVLLVSFFCEACFLQVMVHGNIDTSDYCALGTFTPFRGAISINEPSHQCYPLCYWPASPPLPDTACQWPPRSRRCWRTSHHAWWGPSRWPWWPLPC